MTREGDPYLSRLCGQHVPKPPECSNVKTLEELAKKSLQLNDWWYNLHPWIQTELSRATVTVGGESIHRKKPFLPEKIAELTEAALRLGMTTKELPDRHAARKAILNELHQWAAQKLAKNTSEADASSLPVEQKRKPKKGKPGRKSSIERYKKRLIPGFGLMVSAGGRSRIRRVFFRVFGGCGSTRKRQDTEAGFPGKRLGVDVANCATMTRRLPWYSHALHGIRLRRHPGRTRLGCGKHCGVHNPKREAGNRCRIRRCKRWSPG